MHDTVVCHCILPKARQAIPKFETRFCKQLKQRAIAAFCFAAFKRGFINLLTAAAYFPYIRIVFNLHFNLPALRDYVTIVADFFIVKMKPWQKQTMMLRRTAACTRMSLDANRKQKSKQNFLWWCAGAHQKLVRQFPSEHTKYAGLGGVVLATFVLATLSSGYAIYSVFGNWMWTIAFALIWGLIIFNFDRFLVSTMRQIWCQQTKANLDGYSAFGFSLVNWLNYCETA